MEKQNLALAKFVSEMRVAEFDLFKKEVFNRCLISRTTWRNWITGKSEPNKVCKQLINDIAKSSVFTL